MTPTLITAKNGKARPKNPYPKSVLLESEPRIWGINPKWKDFESAVQWHDCPEAIEDGEHMAELVWQWQCQHGIRKGEWTTFIDDELHDKNSTVPIRQIWRIVPQPQKKTMENRFEIENFGRQAFKFETEAHIKDIQNPDCTIIVQSGYTTLKETDEYTELILNILNETTRK